MLSYNYKLSPTITPNSCSLVDVAH